MQTKSVYKVETIYITKQDIVYGLKRFPSVEKRSSFFKTVKEAMDFIYDWVDVPDEKVLKMSYSEYNKAFTPIFDTAKEYNAWKATEKKRFDAYTKFKEEVEATKTIWNSIVLPLTGLYGDDSEIFHSVRIIELRLNKEKGKDILDTVADNLKRDAEYYR